MLYGGNSVLQHENINRKHQAKVTRDTSAGTITDYIPSKTFNVYFS